MDKEYYERLIDNAWTAYKRCEFEDPILGKSHEGMRYWDGVIHKLIRKSHENRVY